MLVGAMSPVDLHLMTVVRFAVITLDCRLLLVGYVSVNTHSPTLEDHA
jgi:hypothetical protein